MGKLKLHMALRLSPVIAFSKLTEPSPLLAKYHASMMQIL